MENTENKKLNIVIMPKRNGAIFNVAMSPKVIYIFAVLLFLTLVVNGVFAFKYINMQKNLDETKKQVNISSNVSDLKQEAEELKQELEDIKRTNERIKQKTGISPEPGYSEYRRKEVGMPTRAFDPELEELRNQLSVLRVEISFRKNYAEQTENKVEKLVDKFSHVPSIKPIRDAKLTSTFGYRYHPISGKREFHMGMDLDGTTSTPIYATADGRVIFEGWRQGYGRTIEVDHENGFKTTYAHNSRDLVSEGENVVKGQIIGYVGSSGYTTGSHLHYEVRFKDRLFNPKKFMTLTLADIEKM